MTWSLLPEGGEVAQKLADTLGVKILAYEGMVSPFGTRPLFGDLNRWVFPDHKPRLFTPKTEEDSK